MRRRYSAALAVALLVCLPATALAKKAPGRAEYVTSYSGTYTYNQHAEDHTADGRPGDDLTTSQSESFVSVDHNVTTLRSSGRFKNVDERSLLLTGHERQVYVQGRDVPGGPFTTTRDCTLAADPKPLRVESGGVGADAIPISKDPALSLGWEIPDYGSAPARGVPPISIQGMDCGYYGSHFLDCVPSNCATVHTPVPMSDELTTAFSGTASIHYRQLPFSRRFTNLQATGHTETSGREIQTEDAVVVVDSEVTLVPWWTGPTVPGPKAPVNKIGALLLSEGFATVTTQGRPGRGPAGGSGQPDTVIIPPIGQGTLDLNVSGKLVSPRIAASASTTLATGTVKWGTKPVAMRMTINPTAAGRKLLASPHGALKLRYEFSFRPSGSKKTISRAKVLDVPAFTG